MASAWPINSVHGAQADGSTVPGMTPTDLALTIGATLRLTRLATTDAITDWLIGPARRRLDASDSVARAVHYHALSQTRHENKDTMTPDAEEYILAEIQHMADNDDDPITWRARLVSGLDCPYCIGFWIGAATLAAHGIAKRRRGSLRAWRAVAGALSLNYLTGHVSARLD